MSNAVTNLPRNAPDGFLYHLHMLASTPLASDALILILIGMAAAFAACLAAAFALTIGAMCLVAFTAYMAVVISGMAAVLACQANPIVSIA